MGLPIHVASLAFWTTVACARATRVCRPYANVFAQARLAEFTTVRVSSPKRVYLRSGANRYGRTGVCRG
eukprot:3172676-Lingulodinium_polyedra.AAC.1